MTPTQPHDSRTAENARHQEPGCLSVDPLNNSHLAFCFDRFEVAVKAGVPLESDVRAELSRGLCGRILRGKTESDFVTLTDNPDRRVVFTFGPDGLAQMPGLAGVEMLTQLAGATKKHILDKYGPEQNGTPKHLCRLAIFPESAGAFPGTWRNVLDVVAMAYPEVSKIIIDAIPRLEVTPFADFEQEHQERYGMTFKEVDVIGRQHPRYMTPERLALSEGTALDVRAFLYYSLALRELYAGDGYTYDERGMRGPAEYIVPNRPLDALPHRLIPIEIDTTKL